MAKHNVYFDLPLKLKELGNTDATFHIYHNDEKLGQIKLSKGGVAYKPFKRKTPINISWARLDELLRNEE